jgi:hypothetical protein
MDADEAHVHRHPERVGGKFEHDRTGKADRGCSITDYRQAAGRFEVEEHLIGVLVGAGTDGDEGGREELAVLVDGFVESMGPRLAPVDGGPPSGRQRLRTCEEHLDTFAAELNRSNGRRTLMMRSMRCERSKQDRQRVDSTALGLRPYRVLCASDAIRWFREPTSCCELAEPTVP